MEKKKTAIIACILLTIITSLFSFAKFAESNYKDLTMLPPLLIGCVVAGLLVAVVSELREQ